MKNFSTSGLTKAIETTSVNFTLKFFIIIVYYKNNIKFVVLRNIYYFALSSFYPYECSYFLSKMFSIVVSYVADAMRIIIFMYLHVT